MTTKETAYQTIGALVERFHEQKASYKKTEYNETLVRRDFIDPFFKALGWDVDNAQGYAEAYREVIHEDRIKVGTATKAPDYSFPAAGRQAAVFCGSQKAERGGKNRHPARVPGAPLCVERQAARFHPYRL
jgi:predicted type IV restriction endonuclease